MRKFTNGDDLKKELPKLGVGEFIEYHGLIHKVVDTDENGKRIAYVEDVFDCPIHGLIEGVDCPRC
jgi:hypothetical protein